MLSQWAQKDGDDAAARFHSYRAVQTMISVSLHATFVFKIRTKRKGVFKLIHGKAELISSVANHITALQLKNV